MDFFSDHLCIANVKVKDKVWIVMGSSIPESACNMGGINKKIKRLFCVIAS